MADTNLVALVARMGGSVAGAADAYPVLCSAYAQSHRHYHNLMHIMSCLLTAEEEFGNNQAFDLICMALWYHDAVYDPRRSDNEFESNKLFLQHSGKMRLWEPHQNAISEAILGTKHITGIEKDSLSAHVNDVDLSILSADEPVFDEYEDNIRKEYQFAPEQVFRSTRVQILQGILNREWVYSTTHFRRKYEAAARANLNRSITRLQRPEI